MTDAALRALGDETILQLTIWGEARHEPIEGQIAVGCVIRNRVLTDLGHDQRPDWWGEGYTAVCLKPKQFSCWNADDPNRPVLERAIEMMQRSTMDWTRDLRQASWVAIGVMMGALLDNTAGATHYLTTSLLWSAHPPRWTAGKAVLVQRGAHSFLRA